MRVIWDVDGEWSFSLSTDLTIVQPLLYCIFPATGQCNFGDILFIYRRKVKEQYHAVI